MNYILGKRIILKHGTPEIASSKNVGGVFEVALVLAMNEIESMLVEEYTDNCHSHVSKILGEAFLSLRDNSEYTLEHDCTTFRITKIQTM